jgi:cytochrome b561
MLYKDTKDQYGVVSVTLHWIIAVSVIILLCTGTYGFFTTIKNVYRPYVLNFHLSLASTIAVLIVFRFYWRMKYGKPKLPPQKPALDFIAGLVWRLLLIGMLCQLITGPILTWAHKHPIGIVGFLEINSPYPASWTRPELMRIYAVGDFFHALVGFSIAGLVCLHIAGALKHAIIDRDGVLQRMLKPGARAIPKPTPMPRGAEGAPAE